jgi:hypothetical protein
MLRFEALNLFCSTASFIRVLGTSDAKQNEESPLICRSNFSTDFVFTTLLNSAESRNGILCGGFQIAI